MPRAKLTESYIKTVPAPARSVYELHWDTEIKGLTLRVSNNGSRHFVLCYTMDSKNKRHTIGRYIPTPTGRLGAPTAPQSTGSVKWARDEARRLIGELAQGIDPGQQKKDARAAREAANAQEATEITVATLAERYINEHAKPNKRSWREDERRLNAYIVPAWGTRKAKSITRADVKALVAAVATGDGARLAEAGSRLALVTTMFSFAVDQGIIDSHPSLRLKVPGGKPKPRTRTLTTAKEFRVLWRLTDPAGISTTPSRGFWTRPAPTERKTETNRRNERFMHGEGDALRLLMLTGARASEVAELPWAELDLDAATWLLPAERSKNGQANLVPLLPEAMAILRRRREAVDGDYVFPGPRKLHMTHNNLSKPLKRVCVRLQRIGIASFTPHDFRRTVETGMAAAKVPKEYRDRVLNHVDGSVGGKHYNMYDYIDEKREALEKWARRLEGMLTASEPNVVPIRRAAR